MQVCHTMGGHTLGQAVPEGLDPVGGIHAGEANDLQFMGKIHTEKSMEDCLMWEEPHARAGQECGESFP